MLLGYFENITFQVKTGLATFWAFFGKMDYFLVQHLVTLSIKFGLFSRANNCILPNHFWDAFAEQ